MSGQKPKPCNPMPPKERKKPRNNSVRIISTRNLLIVLAPLALWTLGDVSAAEIQDKGVQFFEKKIRPVLIDRCYSCHSESAEKVKGGLLLDSREGIRKGGDSGHAVVPRRADESLLISAIRYEDYEMPPKDKLPDAVIADFERWVRMGAPDPRDGAAAVATSDFDIEAGREFWAFQPPVDVAAPAIPDVATPISDIDRFVLARLRDAGLQSVGAASKETLLRRITLDLIGLPPTPVEIDRFVGDDSDDAYERVVDRLLASKHFGERWGRHWLDVVRYAESIGKTRNFVFPFAWRYRDYVIDAFNNDKPFDHFIKEQIAGDLLPYDSEETRNEQLIATGFLALGSHDLNTRKLPVFRMDVAGEQIDTVSRAFMALTVGCARCHDHKFDPIPTADYYAMAGIFRSTDLLNGYTARSRNNEYSKSDRFIRLTGDQSAKVDREEPKAGKQAKRMKDRLAALQLEMKELQKSLRKVGKNKQLTADEKQERQDEIRQTRPPPSTRFEEIAGSFEKAE